MLHKYRSVLFGLGVLSSLWPLRPLFAQVSLQVSSVNVHGEFNTGAHCPGSDDDPTPVIASSNQMVPFALSSQATTSLGLCRAHASAQTSVTLYQMADGALQITGSSSVNTLDTVLPADPPPDGVFADANASGQLEVTFDLNVTRWCRLSFVGTMSIGTVTAVGSPEFSSALQSQSWELDTADGVPLAERSLSLSSDDPDHTRQDTFYQTVLARPGHYSLRLRVSGHANGNIDQPGTSGWTCSGSFGLAISAVNACVADWDQDGVLDSRDFFEFLNAYFLDAADFNEDSVVDSRDFFDFLNAYIGGCG